MMLGHPPVCTVPMAVPSSAFNPAVTMLAISSVPPTQPYSAVDGTPSTSHVQLYRNPFAPSNGGPGVAGGGSATTAVTPPSSMQVPMADRCLDSYFHNFHGAHPFDLPKDVFLRLVKDGKNGNTQRRSLRLNGRSMPVGVSRKV